jgi:putative N6-adenine-specific DNA methylase
MITNPPYGIRMGEEIEEMYDELGSWMKHEMKGFDCWVLSASEEGFKTIGLKPDRKIKVFNGELECSFRKFSIYDGSKKQSKQTDVASYSEGSKVTDETTEE